MPDEPAVSAPVQTGFPEIKTPDFGTNAGAGLLSRLAEAGAIAPQGGTPPSEPTSPVVETKSEPVVETKAEETVKPDEPAKETAKETEEATEEIPKGLSKHAGDAFKTLKQETKAKDQKIKELSQQLEEAQKSVKAPEDYEEIKTRLSEREKALAEFEERAAIFDVRSTRPYQEQVAKPMASIYSQVEAIAKKYEGLDAKSIVEAFEATGDAKNAALDNLLDSVTGRFDQAKIAELASKWDQTQEIADNLEATASDRLKEIRQQELDARSKWEEQRTKDKEQGDKQAADRLFKNLSFLDNEVGREEISKIKADASKVNLDKVPEEVRSYATMAGLLYPRMVKEINSAKETIATLEERIKEFSGTTPKASGGNATVQDTTKADDKDDFLTSLRKGGLMGVR